MAFTYDSLKQAIQDYTENTETTFVSNLPVFIRATEERILKNVQLNLFMRNQVGSMAAGTSEITVAAGAPTLYYYCTNHSGMGGQANTP